VSSAIAVDGVWKKFHRGERHDSLRDLIPAAARRLVGRGPNQAERGEGDFWALRDVSFRVEPGEALGIIGPNGAGKSTVLKLLSGILRPTRGAMAVRGRVAAMIEVAAGFHPDLTGRENVFLQGAIMGLRRREVGERLEQIVEFAGIAPFIDTPVKRYSTGMNARLGFAIAAHLDPDVLLIDEVLSVGDMAFQEKCVARMKAFKQNGVAIVFVSHNLQAVANLCEQAIYLRSTVQAEGPALDSINAFLSSMQSEQVTPNAIVDIDRVRLLTSDGQPAARVSPGEPLVLEARYAFRKGLSDLVFGFLLYRSTDGLMVYDGNFRADEAGIATVEAGSAAVLRFALRANLTRGQYHFGLLAQSAGRLVGRLSPAAFLQVAETRTYAGVADLRVSVTGADASPPGLRGR
jgi:lipopolysaccharide transport system ATP-binding protein